MRSLPSSSAGCGSFEDAVGWRWQGDRLVQFAGSGDICVDRKQATADKRKRELPRSLHYQNITHRGLATRPGRAAQSLLLETNTREESDGLLCVGFEEIDQRQVGSLAVRRAPGELSRSTDSACRLAFA